MLKLRIQRLLADAGLASRRFAEQMILDGRVTVNGKLVIELPCFVDPDHDDIRLDNQPVRKKVTRKLTLVLNKPRGVECTRITTGRPGVFDVVPPIRGQAFCLAPLDQDSTGLVIITTDGQLRQLMTHHRYAIERTYVVEVDGSPTPQTLDAFRKGVYLDQKRTRPASVVVLGRNAGLTMLGIKIAETHNRELRRVLLKLGHKPRRIKRSAIGNITDKGLKIGHFRQLNDYEIQSLERQATAPEPKAPAAQAPFAGAGATAMGATAAPFAARPYGAVLHNRPLSISGGANQQRAGSVSDGANQRRVPSEGDPAFPHRRGISDKRAQAEARQRAQIASDAAFHQRAGSVSDGANQRRSRDEDDEPLQLQPGSAGVGAPKRRDEPSRKRSGGPVRTTRKRTTGRPASKSPKRLAGGGAKRSPRFGRKKR
jgi:23S rRNA pseudouridine2605 synthase